MADLVTPVYGFTEPEVGGSDNTWGTKLNLNLTKLEDLFVDAFSGGTPTDIGKLKTANANMATQAEAEAGTSTTKFLSPLTGKQLGDIRYASKAAVWQSFATRAALVSFVAINPPPPVGTVTHVAGVPVKYDGDGHELGTDLPGWTRAIDWHIDQFKDNITGTTDMYAAIQLAMDAIVDAGGGFLRFRGDQRYISAGPLLMQGNVFLVGEGFFFQNDYTAADLIKRSTWITMASGINANLLTIRADTTGWVAGYPRCHGGLRDICLDANRSDNYNTNHFENNTIGHAVSIQGASYVTMDNVLTWRAAQNGIDSGSYDYSDGGGARGCNNLSFRNVVSIENGLKGFDIAGGDSIFTQLIAGANGDTGISNSAGPLINALAWNNKGYGATVSAGQRGVITLGLQSYDNDKAGLYIVSGIHHSVGFCNIRNNGRGLGGANLQSGILIGSSADFLNIGGNVIYDDQMSPDPIPVPVPTQKWGIRSTGAGLTMSLGTNHVEAATLRYDLAGVANVTIADAPSGAMHSGFVSQGPIVTTGGSVTAPGLSLTGNSRTGIFRHGTDIMGIAFDGVEDAAWLAGQMRLGAPSNNVANGRLEIVGDSQIKGSTVQFVGINTASGPLTIMAKSHGIGVADRTLVQVGDTLGAINFRGADGAALVSNGASIRASVDGVPTSGDVRAELVFSTGNGPATAAAAMRIGIDQNTIIGTGISPATAKLQVEGLIRGAQYAFGSLPAANIAGINAETMINDCNTAVFNAPAAGGGTNKVKVVSDGLIWKVY